MLNWGGELIYHWQGDRSGTENGLTVHPWSLGVPSVVVALHDIRWPGKHLYFPDLRKVSVGRALGLDVVAGEVHYRPTNGASLPVEAVWQPGSVEYDRPGGLPR